MNKAQTRKALSEVARKIDGTFKRPIDDIKAEVQKEWPGIQIVAAHRDELLAILIKGYVYAAFDPDVKRIKLSGIMVDGGDKCGINEND
jgi:hypothetical protein